MEVKELGNTGIMLPEIGLGTWEYSGGAAPLQRGIELGAFLIDTAEMYRNEDAIGRAIKGWREKVFLAGKVLGSNLRYDQVVRAAETSLGLLDVDAMDLYQIHWYNPEVPIKETMEAMAALVDSGRVKHVGVSNFSVHQLQEAQAAMPNVPIVSNQVHYNLKRRDIEDTLISYCQENKVTVIAYSPLAEGGLTAKPRLRPDRGMRVLAEIAAQVDKTLAQVALNWCIARPNVITIPKSDSVERTVENCDASGWRLSSDQMYALDQAFPR